MDAHAIAGTGSGRSGKTRNEQGHIMPFASQPPEHLVQVNFSATCPRVFSILPIGNDELQACSWLSDPVWARMSASSTPFTKRGLSLVLYFSASEIAS